MAQPLSLCGGPDSHTALISHLDRGYAPRTTADDPRLRKLAAGPRTVEQITCEAPGEWDGTCQSRANRHWWRNARNREVAHGVRKLLADFETAFPDTRVRVVLPPRAAACRAIRDKLDSLPRPGGGVFGRAYFRNLQSTINYIPTIGEGMTMVNLGGLRTEPVVFGIRGLIDQRPLALFMRECLKDLSGNRGSAFRGPRSVFYEAQETLRAADRKTARRRREEIICYLLSLKRDIREVILYEAADWTYYLPLSDTDVSGYGFLDRCQQREER